jgi:hypothetical protein
MIEVLFWTERNVSPPVSCPYTPIFELKYINSYFFRPMFVDLTFCLSSSPPFSYAQSGYLGESGIDHRSGTSARFFCKMAIIAFHMSVSFPINEISSLFCDYLSEALFLYFCFRICFWTFSVSSNGCSEFFP